MADIQALQNLCNVTSLNQLSLGENDQLEKRSGIGTLFRNIGDFFLSLSHAGRAEIAQRNERIVAAMQDSVNEARFSGAPEGNDLAAQLNTLRESLQKAASASKTALLKEIMDDLHKNKLYTALPEEAKAGLDHALSTTAKNRPISEWQGKMDALKVSFLHGTPKGFDIHQGMQKFQQRLTEAFLSSSQQKQMNGDMHASFIKDMERRSIKSFNNEPTPMVADDKDSPKEGCLSPSQLVTYCEDKLRAMAGPHADNIMPFLTMMTTQAGVDSALIFFPHDCGLTSESSMHLIEAGLISLGHTHAVHVTQTEDKLVITSTWNQNFCTVTNMHTPVLRQSGSLSMVIDLNAEPARHTVNVEMDNGQSEERTVYMPQFTFTSDGCSFHAGSEN